LGLRASCRFKTAVMHTAGRFGFVIAFSYHGMPKKTVGA